jgi:hypothetical protein
MTLRLGEVTQSNCPRGFPPQHERGLKLAMSRYHHLLLISQERDIESKRLDALSNLANLFVAMNPRVSQVRLQG